MTCAACLAANWAASMNSRCLEKKFPTQKTCLEIETISMILELSMLHWQNEEGPIYPILTAYKESQKNNTSVVYR